MALPSIYHLNRGLCSVAKKQICCVSLLNMQPVKRPLLYILSSAVCVQASSRRCEGGGCVEEVLRAEEAPWGVGLHTQEPFQKRGGVSTFSPSTTFWYMSKDCVML